MLVPGGTNGGNGGDDPYGGIPKELRPTHADLLMAAAIMHQRGAFDQPDQQPERVAMDISGMRASTNVEDVRARGPDPQPPSALELRIADPQYQRMPPLEQRRPFRTEQEQRERRNPLDPLRYELERLRS
jgi:hypothetical protein